MEVCNRGQERPKLGLWELGTIHRSINQPMRSPIDISLIIITSVEIIIVSGSC